MAISLSDIPRPVGRAPAPDRVTVYDQQGNAYEKWPIDARECVESGSFYYEKPTRDEATKAEALEAVEGAELPTLEAQAFAEKMQPVIERVGVAVDSQPVDQSPLDAIDLAAMTKARLIDLARARGFPANNTMSKDSLIDLLGGVK